MSDSGRTMREQCFYCGRVHEERAIAECRERLARRVKELEAVVRKCKATRGILLASWRTPEVIEAAVAALDSVEVT